MIKKTELMVGDIVKYQCMPTQVEEILLDGINGEWDGNECYGVLDFNSLNPIELTKELLEKNGWKFSTRHSPYMLHVKFNEFALFPQKDGSYNIKQLNFIKNIEYVHELQQAIRFFGDYDLATNFKIK